MSTTPNYRYVGEYVRSQFERGRKALEEGVYDRAIELFTSALRAKGLDPEIEAEIRCSLSEAYEEDTNSSQALEVISKYESSAQREVLPQSLQALVWLRMGLAYDRDPKAISYLNTSLKLAELLKDASAIGQAHLALGRSCLKVDEYDIAHDHLEKAVENLRRGGNRRLLAQSYMVKGNVLLHEGKHDDAILAFESAERLISDKPYYSLLGRILQNRAVADGMRYRCREALVYEERSIAYFERAGQQRSLIRGLNNLGCNSFFLGEIDRAESEWQRASELANELGYPLADANALDGLAQINILRGEYLVAEEKLRKALEIVGRMKSKWYEAQVRQSLIKLHFRRNDIKSGLAEAQTFVRLADQSGDEHSKQLSKIYLSEAEVLNGSFEQAEFLLNELENSSKSGEDLLLAGLLRRLRSKILTSRNNDDEAVAAAAQSVSAFEALGNKYEIAVSQFQLGKCLISIGDQHAAVEVLESAKSFFREVGANDDLSSVDKALLQCEKAPVHRISIEQFSLNSADRLLNSVISRDLLLRELASVLNTLHDVKRVAIFELPPKNPAVLITAHSWDSEDAHKALLAARSNPSAVSPDGLTRIHLLEPERQTVRERAAVLIQTEFGTTSEQINLMLRLAKQGLELCFLRRELIPKSAEVSAFNDQIAGSVGLLVGSNAMKQVLEAIHRIRSSDVTVLITGESGTGKELVARAVHAESARRDRGFVPFNCTTATRDLADSLLFGHRKGAFTGAAEERQGVVRAADGGTLFLDEIGDLAFEVQPKLLRFLQEGEVQPLGMERPIKVDVRVVAATNAELEQLVEQGRFREDLFHRLNVIRLRVPALRERREEIPVLARHFMGRFALESRKQLALSDEATDLLQVFDWPGNVRQLSNEMRRIVALAEDGAIITYNHLSPEIVGRIQIKSDSSFSSGFGTSSGVVIDMHQPMSDAVSQLEREMLLTALKQNNGNISKTARQLGLTRRGLHMKRERLGIHDVADSGS
ncbi:MAG TPA: sigma 54-interacting transcriptional regulator [Blastocatellia bacterium]|nr:sigma 54-interacting transcriptional regulator [Blastocatellia bacterium]